MALFRFLWLRRFIRRHTNPIPLEKASSNKQKLSVVYAFFAWNAVGFIAYSVMTKGKINWAVYHKLEEEDKAPAQSYAKLLKIDNARVIRIKGLSKVDEYDIEKDEISQEIIRKPISE